jgi:hypothetical protein
MNRTNPQQRQSLTLRVNVSFTDTNLLIGTTDGSKRTLYKGHGMWETPNIDYAEFTDIVSWMLIEEDFYLSVDIDGTETGFSDKSDIQARTTEVNKGLQLAASHMSGLPADQYWLFHVSGDDDASRGSNFDAALQWAASKGVRAVGLWADVSHGGNVAEAFVMIGIDDRKEAARFKLIGFDPQRF